MFNRRLIILISVVAVFWWTLNTTKQRQRSNLSNLKRTRKALVYSSVLKSAFVIVESDPFRSRYTWEGIQSYFADSVLFIEIQGGLEGLAKHPLYYWVGSFAHLSLQPMRNKYTKSIEQWRWRNFYFPKVYKISFNCSGQWLKIPKFTFSL